MQIFLYVPNTTKRTNIHPKEGKIFTISSSFRLKRRIDNSTFVPSLVGFENDVGILGVLGLDIWNETGKIFGKKPIELPEKRIQFLKRNFSILGKQ